MDSRTQLATASEDAIAILLIGPVDSRRDALRNILMPPQWEIREAATYRRGCRDSQQSSHRRGDLRHRNRER